MEFDQFERNGFQIIGSVFGEVDCEALAAELTPLFEQQTRSKRSRIGGLRNLLRTNSLVSALAKSARAAGLVGRAAGGDRFPVRALFFDKTPGANWRVPWHQDLAIAVAGRIETPGFAGWSVKDEVVHVHPPEAILDEMITLRLHLDDCSAGNGALRVIAGSQRAGKMRPEEVATWTSANEPVICRAARGDVLLMRPLLLHASMPAENPGHRRVLHIEYAGCELPNGLSWFDR